MREIKFRVWAEGEMEYDVRNIWSDSARPREYMQYTGLKDKQGKEIYEGDIIRYLLDTVEIPPKEIAITCQVQSSEYGWYPMTDESYCYPDAREVEVIGNIYENENLLK